MMNHVFFHEEAKESFSEKARNTFAFFIVQCYNIKIDFVFLNINHNGGFYP